MSNIIPSFNATDPGDNTPWIFCRHWGEGTTDNNHSGAATNIGSPNRTTTAQKTKVGPSGITAGVGGVDSTALQMNQTTNGDNGFRWPSRLAATDFSNHVTGVHMTANSVNRMALDTLKMRYYANGTGNYRVWEMRTLSSANYFQLGYDTYLIDPSVAGTEADTGTYDDSDIDHFGMTLDTSPSDTGTYSWFFLDSQWRVTKSLAGACAIYGSDADFQDYVDEAISVCYTIQALTPTLFRINCPFKIGDGSTATTVVGVTQTIITPAGEANGGGDQFHVDDTSFPFWLDLTASCDIALDGRTFNWGEACVFDFDSNEGATVTIDNCIFGGMGEFTLGPDISGAAVFTLASGSTVIINGADLDGSTINGDAELATDTDLTDIHITGDLLISHGLAVSMDFSNVQVDGNTSVSHASNDVTINASNGSSLTTTDVTGGVPIIVNAVTVNVTVRDTSGSVIVGATVRVVATETVGTITSGDVIMTGTTNGSGVVEITSFNYEGAFDPSGLDIAIRVRKSSSAPYYKSSNSTGNISNTGSNNNVTMLDD